MHKRIEYFIKHSAFWQMVYKICLSFIFRVFGLFVKTKPNLVLFSSFMGKAVNDSPKAIYDYMKTHNEYKEYHCVWAVSSPENYPLYNTVKIDTLKYFYIALKAKYWITNTNIERGLSFKKKATKYLNTWHGIALKTVGNDCPGRKDYNFNSVDFLCVSGMHDENVFKSAFNAKESSFLKCGMPRNDELYRANDAKQKEYRARLNIPSNKKVILYAPTWRESEDSGESYKLKPPIDFAHWEQVLSEQYVVLFRAHIITTAIMGVNFNSFIRDVSNYADVNDLMIASDLLITDYSSIAFDYSILQKPILCFAYDYDTYLNERGTYFDIDEKFPIKALKTEEELLTKMQELDYLAQKTNLIQFCSEFILYGRNATQTCVNKMFSNDERL